MPAFTGPVQILNIGGGVVQFGDTAIISPKSASKYTSGSGSNSSGALINIFDGFSANATIDTNVVDQPLLGNN